MIDSFEPIDHQEVSELDKSPSSLLPRKKTSTTKWLLGSLSLLLLAGITYLACNQLVKQKQQASKHLVTVPLERTNFSITVSANGTIEPEHVVNISPKTAGIVTSLLVKEGNLVKKGQILARMDDSNLQGQFKEAQGKLAQAQANLRKLIAGNRPQDIAIASAKLEDSQANLRKLITGNRPQDITQAQARLDSAKANLSKAEDDFRRNLQLSSAGAISAQLLKQKRSDRDSAQAQVAQTQQALDLMKAGSRNEDIEAARAQVKQQQETLSLMKAGSRSEDIEQAHAEVKSASGSLQNIFSQINDTMIRAPFDGTIVRKYADPGAFVTPMTSGSSVSSATSTSLLALADTNQVVANVAESSISQIRIGQKVIIKADAYPGKTFEGRVSQIAVQATVEQNVTSFKVKVALLKEAQKLLLSGMNVSVMFKVGERPNALTVPTIAVTRQHNLTGVLVTHRDQPPIFTPITTGATVNNRTEVKTGLDGTENILIQLPPEPKHQFGISFPGLPGSSNTDLPKEGPPPGGPPPR